MKFFADESIESEVVKRLRQDHHDVLHVPEIKPGLPDEDVLERARSAKAVLLTHDKNFGTNYKVPSRFSRKKNFEFENYKVPPNFSEGERTSFSSFTRPSSAYLI